MKTYDEAQFFVVSCVHGLALLNAAAVVGLTLNVKSNPAQLEDDVPLSLNTGIKPYYCTDLCNT